MNVTCKQCHSKINIPDDKIPKNKDASFKCPKCKGRIDIKQAPSSNRATRIPPGPRPDAESGPAVYDEMNTALVCVDDPQIHSAVHATLTGMDYQTITAKNYKTALSKMQYHVFNIIVISEDFDNASGLKVMTANLNRMDMTQRRRTCVVLISSKVKSSDPMGALQLSVNHVVNPKDIVMFDQIMLKSVTEHQNLYAVFNDCLNSSRTS